jgi:hypothetical protein
MPTLAITNFNIILSVLGGWISLFGLVSYLCKESFYLSEARTFFPLPNPPQRPNHVTKTSPEVISLLAGVSFSPHGLNLIRPLAYAQNSQANLDTITLCFSRLVLGVQLVLAGVRTSYPCRLPPFSGSLSGVEPNPLPSQCPYSRITPDTLVPKNK